MGYLRIWLVWGQGGLADQGDLAYRGYQAFRYLPGNQEDRGNQGLQEHHPYREDPGNPENRVDLVYLENQADQDLPWNLEVLVVQEIQTFLPYHSYREDLEGLWEWNPVLHSDPLVVCLGVEGLKTLAATPYGKNNEKQLVRIFSNSW